jgi:hypothetical protein
MIIGFTGNMGAGKTTAANHLKLVMLRSGSFESRSFAKPLKNMLRAYYEAVGLPHEEVERRIGGDLKETSDPFLMGRTPRHAMQTLGTEWGRGFIHPDFWVESSFLKPMATGVHVIFDDVRFPNEAAAIQKRGGVVIRVFRPNQELHDSGFHQSERQEFDVDHVISNSGSVQDLREQLSILGRRLNLTR